MTRWVIRGEFRLAPEVPDAPADLEPPMGRAELATDQAILDSREVAQALDLSPDAVNELARKRMLKAFKKGRFWRFHLREVVRFREQLDLESD